MPVWALSVAPADLAGIVAEPHRNRYVDATLTVAGTPHQARVRLHGGAPACWRWPAAVS